MGAIKEMLLMVEEEMKEWPEAKGSKPEVVLDFIIAEVPKGVRDLEEWARDGVREWLRLKTLFHKHFPVDQV